MAIRSTGEMDIESMNEMNVPVVCFLSEPEGEGGGWVFSAMNFMPRKKCCGSSWRIEADTKAELLELINRRVVPLYEAALHNLKNFGENYYWEPKGEGFPPPAKPHEAARELLGINSDLIGLTGRIDELFWKLKNLPTNEGECDGN